MTERAAYNSRRFPNASKMFIYLVSLTFLKLSLVNVWLEGNPPREYPVYFITLASTPIAAVVSS